MPYKNMPDIACHPYKTPQEKLNWVGMSGIELPILVQNNKQEKITLSAKAQVFVSLDDPLSKGIHMSRLYLLLNEMSIKEVISPIHINNILDDFLSSHQGLSDSAMVEFSFNYYESRKSLKSDNAGWKYYQTTVRGELKAGKFECEVSISVPYSSTCPCSAALSRQLIQEAFKKQFASKNLSVDDIVNWLGTPAGINATPHSQRSYAQVKVKLGRRQKLDISKIISQIEGAIQTPVQATVKREDEQEFARLNASNLMFCEDAGRRLQTKLNSCNEYLDYWVRINHLESLHPHDAVAIVIKGVDKGYTDEPNYMDPFIH
jgi:GTP cyclohydrolase I